MELEVGSVLTGKVTGIAKFGAFVSLAPDCSGLVHISEVANTYVNNVEEHLKVGQEVTVKVISIDGNRRVNLSIKQAMPRESGQNDTRQKRFDSERQPRQYSDRGRNGDRQKTPSSGKTMPPPETERPKSENQSFEDTLKKFLQEADSKISESGRYERQSSQRRRNGRR